MSDEQQPRDSPGSGPDKLRAEHLSFPPDPAFTALANASRSLYEEAEADPLAFWERRAREKLSWERPFETVLEWEPPFAKWFLGGQLNVAYNCVDRHVENGLGDKVAYHWIGEPGDRRTLTFADLQREVGKAANALLELGVRTGPGAAHRHARLRAAGRGTHGRLRRLLRGGPERPHPGPSAGAA